MRLRLKASLPLTALALTLTGFGSAGSKMQKNERPRARDVGIKVGILPTGALNAITDVADVRVGQTTLIRGEDVRTGVTAILPHGGNLFREKVPGAVFVGNGFGKLAGSTQVNELGEIETPILLTSTLSVPRVADALLDYMLQLSGNEDVASINPLVAETNDGYLNDIRGRHIASADVQAAIRNARAGAVEEGAVGAGTGTIAFGFKGGIGTSSRRLPAGLGGYTVGVLVQTNFGGVLSINGAPVGLELKRYFLKDELERAAEDDRRNEIDRAREAGADAADGSIIIVIATDAPLDARNLRRLAARGIIGMGRTGAAATNGSGDYVIAFSTAPEVRLRTPSNPTERIGPRDVKLLPNDAMSPLFLAAIEATEEAIYNSLFRARTMTGRGRTIEALPLERTLMILRKYQVISARDREMNLDERKEEDEAAEIEARYTAEDLAATDLDHAAWKTAPPVHIRRNWSGEDAPAERQAEARLLWSDKALHVRFVYQQAEPAIVSSRPQVKRKTIGLWDRDVCELFIAPDASAPERYFEFEAAPTGEWLDLKIHQKQETRETDWEFRSGMTVAARKVRNKVTIAMRVPWKALGRRPQTGERWRGNLFRATGSGATRGYITWRPTRTEEPNFHVPAAFGWIRFKG